MRIQWAIATLLGSILGLSVGAPLTSAEPAKPATPVAKWSFEKESMDKSLGTVRFDGDGPRSPIYPGFAADNKALVLEAPSWLAIADEGKGSRFDFDNGDAITLEAWVRMDSINGDHVYLVSKGRTDSSGAKSVNQNWALRLRKQGGRVALNFLFRSRADDKIAADWHRWTSKTGLTLGSRWHHVAISYRFGDPKSIRGYIDGQTVKGTWDMGGETTRPPVVDDDEVRIGSAYGGLKTVSLDGSLDEIAIHRRIVPAKELLSRFQWDPP